MDKLHKMRIFILSQWMNIDGVEASLLGLLKELDYSKVDVDLFLQHHTGPWMGEIPKEVNLLPEDPAVDRTGKSLARAKETHDRMSWWLTQAARYVAAFWYRILHRCKVDEIGYGQIGWEFKKHLLPKSLGRGRYDLCLIFGGAPGLARLVDAKVKAAWIHIDWSFFKPIRFLARRQFANLDYVVNVSDSAREAFDRTVRLPQSVKSITIENCLSPRWMFSRAKAYDIPVCKTLKLLSVGRLSAQKRFDRALEAAKILQQRGVDFKWIIVGGGEEFDKLAAAASTSGLGNKFILAGQTNNPYPYYKWCDILVCTSDYEGKSVAVREAQIFAKPAVVTKFATAASQVEDSVDGILVERTPEAVADGIEKLMRDVALREAISANCRKRDYANIDVPDKILSLGKYASPVCQKTTKQLMSEK